MPYVCYLCGYQSKYKSNMRAHLKAHSRAWGKSDPVYNMIPQLEDEPYARGSYESGRKRNGESGGHNGKRRFEETLRRDMMECEYVSCTSRCNRGSLPKRYTKENACCSCSVKCRGAGTLPARTSRGGEKCTSRDHGIISSWYLKRQVTSLMRRLVNRHADETRFICDLCGSCSDETSGRIACRDRRRSPVRQPRNRPVSPYACGLLDARCNRASGLSVKKTTHTGGNYDDCGLCYYKSSSSSCDSCTYGWTRADSKGHMMTYSEGNTYERSKKNGHEKRRYKTQKRGGDYARGMRDYAVESGEMRDHNGDPLPYAVVLVTDPAHW